MGTVVRELLDGRRPLVPASELAVCDGKSILGDEAHAWWWRRVLGGEYLHELDIDHDPDESP